MAAADIVQRVKTILSGNGIGEKPVIVLGAADAAETITGQTLTFSIADGTQVAPGDILSIVGAATASVAHTIYVLAVNTNVVTGMHNYLGSPITVADSLDGVIFELSPVKSEHLIWQAVETVLATMLFPDIFKFNTYAITPDLTDYQIELNVAVESIESAYQIYADERVKIPYEVHKHVHTSVSSTGTMGLLYAIDGSSVYVTTREKYLAADTMSEALTQCIATGSAAIVMGATRVSTDLEAASKDSQFRGQRNPANDLWRDFVTMRSSLMEELSSQAEEFEIRRG